MLNWLVLLRKLDNLNQRVGLTIHPLILLLILIVMYEVVLRYLFNAPTIWAHELGQMVFGAYFMLGAGYALLHGAHINVDIFQSRLSPRAKAIMDIFTSALFFLFCWALLYKGGQLAENAINTWKRSDSSWAPPLAPSMIVLVVGAGLLTLQGLVKFIRDIITVVKGTETS